jgi:hypothetical protein
MTTHTPISDMSSTQNSPPIGTSIARATDNAGMEAVIPTPSSRQLGASVGGPSRDDPFVGLTRDLSN